MSMAKMIVNYCLIIVFLSMFMSFMPLGMDLKTVKASSWWDTASQGGLDKVGQAYGQKGTPSEDYDIRIIAARIIRIVLELLGIIALAIIIYAGFKWMTAAGDESKVEDAKKQLVNGLIGLVIILVAYSIATFVFYRMQYITTGIMPVTWSW